MKKIPLILALILCGGLFASCGNNDRGSGSNHMYDAPLNGNPQSLDPQFANDESSDTVNKNLYSGLMITDNSGNISCCNAESYTVSEDGTVYTFTLRQDNYWFFDQNNDDVIDEEECFPVTADDYVFAIQRVLDPSMRSPYAKDFLCIKGAELVMKGLEPPKTAEIYAPDKFTLIAVLEKPDAEFLRLMSTAAAYPCNREFFESTKGRYGLDDRSVMSNGAFYVRQWFYDPYGVNNILYMRRNEKNLREGFNIEPSYLSFNIQRNEEDIAKLFKDKDIDCFTTMNASSYNPKKYLVTGQAAVTLGIVFNPENAQYSNAELRKALACAVDRSLLEKNADEDLSVAGGIIPPAVMLMGRSYRELSTDRQFYEFLPDEALNHYETAKAQLQTQNIESAKILVNGDIMDSGIVHTLTQSWQEIFGSYIGIEEVKSDVFYSRIENGEYTIALYPLKANQGIGKSFFRTFEETDCLKSAVSENAIPSDLTSCSTADELVEKYTSAEKMIIDSNWFIPIAYKKAYLIAGDDNEDIFYDPFTGAVDYRKALNYN